MKLWRGQDTNLKPAALSPKDKAYFYLGLSSVFFLLALNAYFYPLKGIATGRWSWIKNMLSSQFGESGELILYLLMGLVLLVLAFHQYSRRHD